MGSGQLRSEAASVGLGVTVRALCRMIFRQRMQHTMWANLAISVSFASDTS